MSSPRNLFRVHYEISALSEHLSFIVEICPLSSKWFTIYHTWCWPLNHLNKQRGKLKSIISQRVPIILRSLLIFSFYCSSVLYKDIISFHGWFDWFAKLSDINQRPGTMVFLVLMWSSDFSESRTLLIKWIIDHFEINVWIVKTQNIKVYSLYKLLSNKFIMKNFSKKNWIKAKLLRSFHVPVSTCIMVPDQSWDFQNKITQYYWVDLGDGSDNFTSVIECNIITIKLNVKQIIVTF